MNEREELLDKTMIARAAAWQAFGDVDADVLTHLMNPYDAGEGDPGINGLGLEFYAATSDELEELPCSWLWDLVWQMSNFAASHGSIRSALDEMGILSTELYDVNIPYRLGLPVASLRY